jgi:ABC-type nitrate/sulfonate/bicarbonate transport system substrate-binding protein
VSSTGSASLAGALRIGGVPEHFNLPWHLAMESGATRECPLDWRDYTSGTGEMLADLAAGTLDLAVLLTEGAALGIARGLPITAVSLYTRSPLIWGVHTVPGSRFAAIDDLRGARFAISRTGSGSHLMSLALALQQGWPVAAQRLVVVGDLAGARAAFREDRADALLWEHFTTEPEIEAGRFRRIGDFVAPWPAWVLCARRPDGDERPAAIAHLCAVVAAAAAGLVADPSCARLIASRYGLREAAVLAWLARTEWVRGVESPEQALGAARRMLEAAGAIPSR